MKLLMLAPALLLMSCTLATPEKDPPVVDLAPRCGADQLRHLVGQDGSVLRGIELPETTRVVHPGMAITSDYRPDRLNISIDAAGIIDRVWCV